ncbi:AIPR family protein [Leuconostoc miyukkimchii]|uniref:AIPR family protein n=1 Tax=Leuconostoc miyukkimchii TaxID=910540 RepID=UPI001C7CB597|nr:AIPR family protein [Leuconostoc miyukkimchii]
MITKFDSYYDRILSPTNKIVHDEGFSGDGAQSKAFGFWFLKNYVYLSDQDINEQIIDGSDDNGIDAYLYDSESKTLNVYQFKWPKKTNTNSEIDQSAILKIYDGISGLIHGNFTDKSDNDGFQNLVDLFNNNEIYKIVVNFVSFNKGIQAEKNLQLLDRKKEELKDFVEVENEVLNRDDLINLFDKLQRKNSVDISLKYRNMQSAYSIEGNKEIDSWVGVVNATDLISTVKDKLSIIFDENIRLFETGSKVNTGITQTASDSRSSSLFYFYNNGITMICDESRNSPGTSTISLKGVSIVNGCQTVTSLANASKKGNLQDDVNILIRIIQIKSYDERSQITEYLNSQTPIKESYFIANHVIIRELQDQLLEKHYYLERQIGELSYRKNYGEIDQDYNNFTVLKLENVIQHYVGAFLNNKSAQAKSSKGTLFDKSNVEDMLSDISANKVIKAEYVYNQVSSIVTKYRKNRRNESNQEFTDYLDVDKNKYISDEYAFVNTGDIIILNAVINLERACPDLELDQLIKKAILLIKDTIKESDEFREATPASLTKTIKLYSKVQDKIRNIGKSVQQQPA